MTETPSSSDILEAALIAQSERAALRDSPEGERSMLRAVNIFNAAKNASILSEVDGWLFMQCLKMARSQQGEPHVDDYVDEASYASLRGEAVFRQGSVR